VLQAFEDSYDDNRAIELAGSGNRIGSCRLLIGLHRRSEEVMRDSVVVHEQKWLPDPIAVAASGRADLPRLEHHVLHGRCDDVAEGRLEHRHGSRVSFEAMSYTKINGMRSARYPLQGALHNAATLSRVVVPGGMGCGCQPTAGLGQEDGLQKAMGLGAVALAGAGVLIFLGLRAASKPIEKNRRRRSRR
jgi:hypothetical protein